MTVGVLDEKRNDFETDLATNSSLRAVTERSTRFAHRVAEQRDQVVSHHVHRQQT